MKFLNRDIMSQVGKDVEYRRAHDAVVLNIEQMGCEWEELREENFISFVDYIAEEQIEWMPNFEWGQTGIRYDIL